MGISNKKPLAVERQTKGDSSISKVSFTIRDTEFIIRFLLSNSIEGKDVEICNDFIKKFKKIHEQLMSERYEVQ